jgi:hypothetical protein
MTRKQWLVIVLLGLADCVVLGGLIFAVTQTSRLIGTPSAVGPSPTPSPTATPALPPTWTPTPTFTPAPTPTPRPTPTPAPPTPTSTPFPTLTPTPIPPPELVNGTFDQITPAEVPGWTVSAVANWSAGQPYDPENSYAYPKFKYADDPVRFITGNTLQIESTDQYAKFQVTLYQVVNVPAGTQVQFEIKAKGYADEGGIQMRAGIDPNGGAACERGQWSATQSINQNNGLVVLRSPRVRVGTGGRVTVCFSARPDWAVPHKAAFFDDARLLVFP